MKLEPCPICGEPVDWNEAHDNVLVCDHCNLTYTFEWKGTRERYAKVWNQAGEKTTKSVTIS